MAFSSDPALQSNQLSISMDFPLVDSDQFNIVLTETFKKIANVVNTKEGALYNPNEIATFKLLAPTSAEAPYRSVYRKTLDMVVLNGANIGASATVSFPHGIVGIANTMLIYASCTTTTGTFFTVVYPNVFLDATNVTFVNPIATTLSQCIVIAEYVKSI